ncbi:MAG: LysM peptidoglycan-binding domain-containing protein, partial [Candidatus Carbobacillus sp.]|nr:LysM peptidoglycan-binding domain-containing protein [Candidatus Carbobacillus sp.]
SETVTETSSETVTETSSETMVYERLYTVQPGDTLYRIAMKIYGNKASIETIRAANGLKNNTIYVGQQLKLPSTSSLP